MARHPSQQELLETTGVDKNELAKLILEGSDRLNGIDEGDEDVSKL